MDADDLLNLADFADRRAERHGIISLSGRLQFLVPVMLWGSYFDIDPPTVRRWRWRWLVGPGPSAARDGCSRSGVRT